MPNLDKKQDWQPQLSMGGLILSVGHKMQRRSEEALLENRLGHISFGRFWVMHELYLAPQNQANLCKKRKQSAPAMMEMLGRLLKEGLVQHKASATDSRKKLWSLSKRGKSDYLKAREVLRDVGRGFDAYFLEKNITPAEVKRTKEILFLLSRDYFGKGEE